MSIIFKSSHQFSVELAIKIGVENAIFIQDIAYWIDYNKSSGINFVEGRTWTYSTIWEICNRHPYWTKKQVERIINNCKREGWLLTGCYNKDPRDRTTWYSLSDEMISFFYLEEQEIKALETGYGKSESEKSISPNKEMTFLQTGSALPNNINQNNIKKNTIPPLSPTAENQDYGFGQELEQAFSDWLTYKQEKREPYKPTGLKSLVTQIRNNVQKYGEHSVACLIRECMASNWKGIIWERIEKQSYPQSNNRKPVPEPTPSRKLVSTSPEALDQIRQDRERMERYRKKLQEESQNVERKRR